MWHTVTREGFGKETLIKGERAIVLVSDVNFLRFENYIEVRRLNKIRTPDSEPDSRSVRSLPMTNKQFFTKTIHYSQR